MQRMAIAPATKPLNHIQIGNTTGETSRHMPAKIAWSCKNSNERRSGFVNVGKNLWTGKMDHHRFLPVMY
jgi:hypothetical protein